VTTWHLQRCGDGWTARHDGPGLWATSCFATQEEAEAAAADVERRAAEALEAKRRLCEDLHKEYGRSRDADR
jgi:hypothetical protein